MEPGSFTWSLYCGALPMEKSHVPERSIDDWALLLMKPVCSKTTGKSKYALMEDKWIFIFKCVSIANIRKLFIICNK
jgi:hypothetical protein